VGVYTLDVITQKGNAKAAYEGILVISQQPTTVISETTRNVINQEINQNTRVIIDPIDPPICPDGEECPPIDPPICPDGEDCPEPPPPEPPGDGFLEDNTGGGAEDEQGGEGEEGEGEEEGEEGESESEAESSQPGGGDDEGSEPGDLQGGG
jgi:hypothetical protein